MKHLVRLAALLLVVAVMAVAGFAALASRGQSTPGRVYPVAQVLAGLTRHPGAWAGRTVLVQGAVVGYVFGNTTIGIAGCRSGPCGGSTPLPPHVTAHLVLAPISAAATVDGIGMSLGDGRISYGSSATGGSIRAFIVRAAPAPSDGLLAALRRLPLVGRLVPPAGLRTVDTSGVYRVQLLGRPCRARLWHPQICDDAVLQ